MTSELFISRDKDEIGNRLGLGRPPPKEIIPGVAMYFDIALIADGFLCLLACVK